MSQQEAPNEEVIAAIQAIKSDVRCVYDTEIDAAAIHSENALSQMLSIPQVEQNAGHIAAMHPNVPQAWASSVLERALHPAMDGEPDRAELVTAIAAAHLPGNTYLDVDFLRHLYEVRGELAHANGISVRSIDARFAGNANLPSDLLDDLAHVTIASAWDESTAEVLLALIGNPSLPANARGALAVRIADEEQNGPIRGLRSTSRWAELAGWAIRDEAASSALSHRDLSALIVAAAA